jgi:hypothetical protein
LFKSESNEMMGSQNFIGMSYLFFSLFSFEALFSASVLVTVRDSNIHKNSCLYFMVQSI